MKKRVVKKKLALNKKSIAQLNKEELCEVYGGTCNITLTCTCVTFWWDAYCVTNWTHMVE